MFKSLFAIALMLIALPEEALAYLDPGTGSALIQVLIASAMGAAFVMRLYWRKVLTLFGVKSTDDLPGATDGVEAGSDRDGEQ